MGAARWTVDFQRQPVHESVADDPLYLANEGTLVVVVPPDEADAALAAMRGRTDGAEACAIGTITAGPSGDVVLQTRLGSERLVDLMIGDQLPRIC